MRWLVRFMNVLAIVGLGYVGLPLALQFARSGARVIGLDIDGRKTDAINAGRSYIKHVSSGEIMACREAGLLEASTDFSRVAECSAVLLCVPTPLSPTRAGRNRWASACFIRNTPS